MVLLRVADLFTFLHSCPADTPTELNRTPNLHLVSPFSQSECQSDNYVLCIAQDAPKRKTVEAEKGELCVTPGRNCVRRCTATLSPSR